MLMQYRHVTIKPYKRIWIIEDKKTLVRLKYKSFIRDVVFAIKRWDVKFTLTCIDKDLYELIELNCPNLFKS